MSSQLLRARILYCGCLYSLPLSWGWWGLSQLTLEMEWPWGMPETPLGVVPHLNSTETSLRPRTAESLIMRSNGMSWRELFPLLPYCLIILSQPPVSLESLIPANHAPGKGIKQWQGINGDKSSDVFWEWSICLWFIATTRAHICVFVTSHCQTIWTIYIQSEYLWLEFVINHFTQLESAVICPFLIYNEISIYYSSLILLSSNLVCFVIFYSFHYISCSYVIFLFHL